VTSSDVESPVSALPPRTRWLILAGLAVAVGLGAFVALKPRAKTQYFTAKVERGSVHDVVEATGTINAVVTVQVGSQVSGSIARLNVDFNSRVHKGDVIALIDPALFQGALAQASADLDNARANVIAARANLDKARAIAFQAKADYDRTAELARSQLASQQQLDLAKATYDSEASAVGAAAANVTQAEAQANQKAAALAVAQTNLNYTVIRSPIDGTVVARNVELGQTVAASLQAPTIFTIAQDLTKMLVYTKTDESDVGNIRPGKPVTFKVDAFPKETFRGVVGQVRMNPTTVQNVVTYDTIIEFANPDLKLFPGMTAYVTIPVASVENALKVPNTALRYKPPLSLEETRALFSKYGVSVDASTADTGASGAGGGKPKVADGSPSGPRPAARDVAVVWKLHPGRAEIEPIRVSLGITDHAYTEVTKTLEGKLEEGDELVIRSVSSKSSAPGGIRR
jgi:HlyD family secretion protein